STAVSPSISYRPLPPMTPMVRSLIAAGRSMGGAPGATSLFRRPLRRGRGRGRNVDVVVVVVVAVVVAAVVVVSLLDRASGTMISSTRGRRRPAPSRPLCRGRRAAAPRRGARASSSPLRKDLGLPFRRRGGARARRSSGAFAAAPRRQGVA